MENNSITLQELLNAVEEKTNKIKNIPINESDFLDGEERYDNGRLQGKYEELVWMRNALQEVVNLKSTKKEHWVRCKDSMPTKDGEYLCTMRNGQMLVCRYSWNCPYTRDWFFFGDRRVSPVAWYTGVLPEVYDDKKEVHNEQE